MLQSLLTAQFLSLFLVFARVGTALMLLPGFGEVQIPIRVRLALAVLISLALAPAVPVPLIAPDQLVTVSGLLVTESLTGLWIGACARILFSALHFAGSQIGYASGLSNAFAPGMAGFEGATAIAGFLLVAALAAIFTTNTHHVMIRALVASYEFLPFGGIMLGDFSREIVRVAAGSLWLGTVLAAPFFVLGLLLNLGLGLANRMLPTLPVFFVAAPGMIAAGFILLAVAVPAILAGFTDRFAEWLGSFVF